MRISVEGYNNDDMIIGVFHVMICNIIIHLQINHQFYFKKKSVTLYQNASEADQNVIEILERK